MKKRLLFLCSFLTLSISIPVCAQTQTPEAQNQDSPTVKLFEWRLHGTMPYHQPCQTRRDVADFFSTNREKIKIDLLDPKKGNLPEDLTKFILEEFLGATRADSQIEKKVLNIGDRFSVMFFKNGAVHNGIVMAKSEPSWELLIPGKFKGYARTTVALPLVCCNITLSQPAGPTLIMQTSQSTVPPAEKTHGDVNIYHQNQYNINIYQKTETNNNRTEINNNQRPQPWVPAQMPKHAAGPGKKIVLVLAGVAGAGAVYWGTHRNHKDITPYKPVGGGGGVN